MPGLIQTAFKFSLLAGLAFAPVPAATLGFAAAAETPAAPGYFVAKFGSFKVVTLLDGGAAFQPAWLQAGPQLQSTIAEEAAGAPHFLDSTVSGFLIDTGSHLILVDAGTGGWWGGPSFGHLLANLKAAGYDPAKVDTVLITHLHADHVGGLTAKDGTRLFPNATVHVAKADSDFWLSREIAAKAPADAKPFFDAAQAVAAPYVKAGRWDAFVGTPQIMEGVRVLPLPGHSPGHSGYEFTSGSERLVIWGDVVHVQRVQLEHPEVTVAFDLDPKQAAASRAALLPSLVDGKTLIAGPHMTFPAIGRLRKEGDQVVWDPIAPASSLIER